ncbi:MULTISPECIES: hypothetical protein [Mycolicibacterium]|uniref:Intersectin-EH binding protein Ibp1 n=2 Tax=Mycolicibacterium TaxID=1866885 RepID=A0AAD1MDG8_9MYCO|nr:MULTISPECIES: hypothetical protein [Mycolicibacterium]MCV7019394.1 hypothetical protein [Mycolicibacterium aichiense]MCV7343339.1 hypothetical protein [Mycolicibacterium rhodesiae]ORB47498.1 hypothetical protein BST42_27595 [Mycolicibacterium rhodesiae]STZ82100.1 Uncharacterised protein [Mycolicibacterium aichiense]BBX08299.1 hypothetical protein MAIC_31020 [Mycolicibacterium aichiense]
MEFATSLAPSRRLVYGIAGLMIAAAPAVAVFSGAFDGAMPRVLACSESDTEDSFSMNCAPSVIPDTSDMLTEAEVAEPGWNGGDHGGGPAGGAPGSGGHR